MATMSGQLKRRRAVDKDGGLDGQTIDMALVGDGVWESYVNRATLQRIC